jgi:GH24 family phage-related lysozyme (muramidase)
MAKWQWCLVGDNDVLLIGWQNVGDFWYYLKPNGSMATGWIQDNDKWYYLNEKGQMLTGWHQDSNGKWYYLYETTDSNKAEYKGAMAVSCTITINNKSYTFNEDGSMVENSLVSEAGIDFIKSWEGFYPVPYTDCVGVLTLGYGMTGDEITGLTSITEPEASAMLKDWINRKYANIVKDDLDAKCVTLAQNEFDALISFAYNCGTGALLNSTLYKNVVAGVIDSSTITADFQAWSNGGGRRIEGLYRRRTKEAAMFLNADYTGNI